MNCPVCGTESPDSVNYCPTCGTPLQASPASVSQPIPLQQSGKAYAQPAASQATAQSTPQYQPANPADPAYAQPTNPVNPAYAQQTAQYQPTPQVPPTQQMPPTQQYQQPGYQQPPQQYATPMNPSYPQQRMGRSVDMSAATKSPKWPIVLIVVLIIVIVVAVVLLLHPWSTGAQDGTAVVSNDGSVVVTSVEGTDQTQTTSDAGTAVIGEQTVDQTQAQTQSVTDAEVYTQLAAAYDQFDGFNARIGVTVDFFNSNYPSVDAASLQSQLDYAQTLQNELNAQKAALDAVVLPEGSAYGQTLQNLKTLNNDLLMRNQDLIDAMTYWYNGDTDTALSTVGRHNEGNQSTYKTEYESLYPNARPAQV